MKIEDLEKQINSVMGEGTLRRGSDPSLRVEYLPTGVLPLDHLLGGGLPTGRFIEVFGDSSALKSYIALKAIGSIQSQGKTCALVDTEHAFDPDWAEHLGVNVPELLLQHPPTGEAAVRVTEVLIRNQVDLIVWDSVAATLPQAYQKATPGEDEQPARLAAMMSKACARLNAANTKTSLLFVNQTRINVGITFGAKDTTPGGKALGYYASLRVRFTKAGKVTQDTRTWDGDKWTATKEVTGQKIKMTLEKSKLSSPNREAWFTFDLASGEVDSLGYLLAQGLEKGLIRVNGAWWTLPEVSIKAQGQEKFRLAMTQEAEEWLKRAVMMPSGRSPGPTPERPKSKAVRRRPKS